MTQPLMYNLIEQKRSVRKLYTEALVGRGDITEEEYEAAHRDFQDRLERAFMETHAAQTASTPVIIDDQDQDGYSGEPETTGVSEAVVQLIGDGFNNKPAGFTVHAEAPATAPEAPRHEP